MIETLLERLKARLDDVEVPDIKLQAIVEDVTQEVLADTNQSKLNAQLESAVISLSVVAVNQLRKRLAFDLYKSTPVRGPSGSLKDGWVKQDNQIVVSLYDQSAQNQLTFGSSGARVKQYDYLGLTKKRTLIAGKYRLERDGVKYLVKGVNNEGRLAQLFLEVIANG